MPVFRVIPNGPHGAFIVQGITGLGKKTVSVWYNADGSVMDAAWSGGGTSRPVQQHGPTWNTLERRAERYRKMLQNPA